MSRDKLFYGGVAALSLLVPGALLMGQPFAEAREPMGTLTGWALALLIIVPSYLLLSRVIGDDDNQRFFRAWAGSTAARFVVVLVGTVLFAVLVDDAPIKSFLLSFFLGYMLLTGLELALVLSGRNTSRRHA